MNQDLDVELPNFTGEEIRGVFEYFNLTQNVVEDNSTHVEHRNVEQTSRSSSSARARRSYRKYSTEDIEMLIAGVQRFPQKGSQFVHLNLIRFYL